MNILSILILTATLAVIFTRCRRSSRTRNRRFGWLPGGAQGLGLALQQLAKFVQPRAEHAIHFQMQEEMDEDEGGDLLEPDAQRHLILRQAARIRRGTHTGQLIALATLSNDEP